MAVTHKAMQKKNQWLISITTEGIVKFELVTQHRLQGFGKLYEKYLALLLAGRHSSTSPCPCVTVNRSYEF
jgi:hypothetical protein